MPTSAKRNETERSLPDRRGAARFPIVGIGASAGGLAALEDLFRHVTRPSRMAFVVVQHVNPAGARNLLELLQRVTSIRVRMATDKLLVRPGNVYIAPGDRCLSISEGRLRLRPKPQSHRVLDLPINAFFQALAIDQREWSVGVVLSGMGTDGSSGLVAIKANRGTACTQSLSSAKYKSMPRSALELGVVDIVAPAGAFPELIRERFPRALPATQAQRSSDEERAQRLARRAGSETVGGGDLVRARIARRMSLNAIRSYTEYASQPRTQQDETARELLDRSTRFFRDPEAWEHLRTAVIPELLRRHDFELPLRAWVPGCSTGEEAYSLAIVLREALDEFRPSKAVAVRIFATDLDATAVAQARRGDYPCSIIEHVSASRLERFFVTNGRRFTVRSEIRDMLIFAPHDLRADPPFSRLDLLSCRNVLCDLSADFTALLIPLFRFSLRPGGILFLGSAEFVDPFATLFTPLNGRDRIYRRR